MGAYGPPTSSQQSQRSAQPPGQSTTPITSTMVPRTLRTEDWWAWAVISDGQALAEGRALASGQRRAAQQELVYSNRLRHHLVPRAAALRAVGSSRACEDDRQHSSKALRHPPCSSSLSASSHLWLSASLPSRTVRYTCAARVQWDGPCQH